MMMRVSYLGFATAILVATPAVAQNNVATNAANVTTANEMTGNAEAATNATLEAATPGSQPIPPSAVAQTATAPEPQRQPTERGFPWGVLGVLGLIGLFGRRRSRS
jgi:MYXO-CTERM domain-containing protein